MLAKYIGHKICTRIWIYPSRKRDRSHPAKQDINEEKIEHDKQEDNRTAEIGSARRHSQQRSNNNVIKTTVTTNFKNKPTVLGDKTFHNTLAVQQQNWGRWYCSFPMIASITRIFLARICVHWLLLRKNAYREWTVLYQFPLATW